MGSERRGRAVHGRLEVNPSGEEPTDGPKQKNAGLWEPYDGRLSRTVLREREGEVPSRHSPGCAAELAVRARTAPPQRLRHRGRIAICPGLGLAQPARYPESSEWFVVAFRHHRRFALPLLLANFLADAPVGGSRVTACWLLARLLTFLLPEL